MDMAFLLVIIFCRKGVADTKANYKPGVAQVFFRRVL
jgi:hypothetical protein